MNSITDFRIIGSNCEFHCHLLGPVDPEWQSYKHFDIADEHPRKQTCMRSWIVRNHISSLSKNLKHLNKQVFFFLICDPCFQCDKDLRKLNGFEIMHLHIKGLKLSVPIYVMVDKIVTTFIPLTLSIINITRLSRSYCTNKAEVPIQTKIFIFCLKAKNAFRMDRLESLKVFLVINWC